MARKKTDNDPEKDLENEPAPPEGDAGDPEPDEIPIEEQAPKNRAERILYTREVGMENDAFAMLKVLDEAVQAVGERGEPARLIVMGETPWFFWSRPECLGALQQKQLIDNKAKLRSGLEIRYAPSLGDYIIVA